MGVGAQVETGVSSSSKPVRECMGVLESRSSGNERTGMSGEPSFGGLTGRPKTSVTVHTSTYDKSEWEGDACLSGPLTVLSTMAELAKNKRPSAGARLGVGGSDKGRGAESAILNRLVRARGGVRMGQGVS